MPKPEGQPSEAVPPEGAAIKSPEKQSDQEGGLGDALQDPLPLTSSSLIASAVNPPDVEGGDGLINVGVHTLTAQMPVRVSRTGTMGDLQRTIHEEHGGPAPDAMKLLKDRSGQPGDAYSEDALQTLEGLGIVDGTTVHMTGQDEAAGRARREARETQRKDAAERAELASLKGDNCWQLFVNYFLRWCFCCCCCLSNFRDICLGYVPEKTARDLKVVELRNLPVGELTAPQRDFLAAESKKVKCKLCSSALIWLIVIWLILDALNGCVLSGCGEHGDCETLSAWHVTHCVCDDDYTYVGAHCTTPTYSEEDFASFAAANFSRWYQFSGSWRHTTNNEAWHGWFWTHTDNPGTYVAVKTCNGLPLYQQAGGAGHVLYYSNSSWFYSSGAWYVGRAREADCEGGIYAIRPMAAIPPDDANTTTSWEEYLGPLYNNGMFPTTFGIVRSGP